MRVRMLIKLVLMADRINRMLSLPFWRCILPPVTLMAVLLSALLARMSTGAS